MEPGIVIRPFLKWPGGKYRLIAALNQHLPKRTHFIEPFVGAGALFLNTAYPKMLLNDINPDLINLYQQLQHFGAPFIQESKTFFTPKHNRKSTYYRLRKQFNQTNDKPLRAMLFLYLNRHGYNGLCRYNLKGGYNVPFGDYKKPYFPEHEMMHCHQHTQRATFRCEHYTSVLKRWLRHPGISQSVIYCDPPYTPLSKTANFTSYAGLQFTQDDHIELAHYAKKLAKKGSIVVISNHDTPFTRSLYEDARLFALQVTRSISCQGTSRQKASELIACFSQTLRE